MILRKTYRVYNSKKTKQIYQRKKAEFKKKRKKDKAFPIEDIIKYFKIA